MPGKDNDRTGKDFEQQIRDGLQDWTMAPAGQVRSAVLERVGRQRRRRALLWMPLGLLLLGLFVGGVFWLTSVRSRQTAAQRVPTPTTASTGVSATTTDPSAAGRHPGEAGVPGAAVAVPVPESAKGQGIAGAPRSGAVAVAVHRPSGVPGRESAMGYGAAGAPTHESGSRYTGSLLRGGVTGSAETDASVATDGSAAVARLAAPDLYLSFSNGYLFLPPPESGASMFIFRPLAPAGSDSHAGETTTSLGNKSGFQIYIAAGAVAQGSFLRFHTPAHTSLLSAASSIGLANNSGQTGDTLASSSSKPGVSVGVSWLWRLSEHWGAELGLEFDSWETVFSPLQVNGSYLAPGVSYTTSGYYAAGYGSSMTNRYRLLQLPVDISWHIAPRCAWNPTLYLGLSPSYLLAGKGLVYIPDGSGYEKDASLYRHWSLSGVSGFRADLAHLGKYRLQAGPVLQYDLMNLQKNAPVSDHLNYIGITLGVFRPWK